jgi:GGDEF domain-containing protein
MFFKHVGNRHSEAADAAQLQHLPDDPDHVLFDEAGLHHRWYLERRLREEVARAGRTKNMFSLAVWQLKLLPTQSLDADLLNQAVPAILKSLRWYDVAARIDSQRLAALFLDTGHERVAAIAYRIKCDLQVRLPSAGKLQLGTATYRRDGTDIDTLLQAAEHSLEADARAA